MIKQLFYIGKALILDRLLTYLIFTLVLKLSFYQSFSFYGYLSLARI